MCTLRTLFPLIILALLLAGCIGQPTNANSLEDYRMPTDVASPSSMTETAEAEIALSIPPADCPVTTAENGSFKAPEPYSPKAPWEDMFWFGSEELWTALQTNGVWSGLPDNPEGYTQKIMWWSQLFNVRKEQQPVLSVSGRRLDAEASPLKFYGATNASAGDIGDAMLTGVDFPALGCWEITGEYKNSELTFVVWIAP